MFSDIKSAHLTKKFKAEYYEKRFSIIALREGIFLKKIMGGGAAP